MFSPQANAARARRLHKSGHGALPRRPDRQLRDPGHAVRRPGAAEPQPEAASAGGPFGRSLSARADPEDRGLHSRGARPSGQPQDRPLVPVRQECRAHR